MKRICFNPLTLLIVLTLFNCSSFVATGGMGTPGPFSDNKDGMVFFQLDSFGVTIVGFEDLVDVIYDPDHPTSLNDLAASQPHRILMNGSYFEASRVHAGWLSVYGDQHAPLKDDRQLSHMASQDRNTPGFEFVQLQDWDSSMTSSDKIEFQTGPLVVDANMVDTLSIGSSINGSGQHLRTLLAYTEEDSMRYFIITRELCRLDELGDYLLSLPLFAGKTLWVMNLDGGSSTALYVRDYPQLNFNMKRRLPIYLGVK